MRDLISGDKRIKAIRETFGQYYSVPDRDDLPEWTLLTIDVRVRNESDLKKFMQEAGSRLADIYGAAALAELDFEVL